MANCNLVTAGDNIKVWKDAKLVDQFIAHDSPTSQINWSPDGNFLASTSLNGEKVTVSHFKCLSATIELKSDNSQTYVRFGSTTSRYLATCGKQSQVLLWDLKSRKIRKQLNTSFDAVTCLGFNANDTHVACGSINGSVAFINTKSGVCNQPMVTSKNKPICSLAFSRMNNSTLGTVSEDGSFNLWNVNKGTLVHSFNGIHVAPATGLAFSPVNHVLAITIGLDKRFVFYDVTNKKVVRTTVLNDPLTCLDFLDGEKLAVGTMTGEVQLYDLRTSSAPIKTFKAHESEINSLHFQKFNTVSKDDLNWNVDEVAAEVNARLQLNAQNQEAELSFIKETDVMNVFSPLQDASPCFRPFNILNDSPLCTPDLLGGRSPRPETNANSHKQRLTVPDQSSVKKSPNNSRNKIIHSPLPLTSICDDTQPPPINAKTLEVPQQAQQQESTASAAHSFNTNLLRNIVTDSTNDVKEAIHKDIVNLHVEMIKKFQLQQMQIEHLFRQYSINDDLVAEIERLREENIRLRMNY